MPNASRHLALWIGLGLAAVALGAGPRAAILQCDLPGHGPATIRALSEALRDAGYETATIDLDSLARPDASTAAAPDLLVLPHAAIIPATFATAIDQYLRGGGDLIALRSPLSLHPPIRVQGRWVDREQHLAASAAKPPPHVLYDLSRGYAGWSRISNHPEFAATADAVSGEPGPGLHAVHVKLANLEGWDTYTAPAAPRCFAEGQTLTILAARGSSLTRNLSVEWEEKDGSRWIAVVPLSQGWKRIVIAPEEFKYWQSNPNRGRGSDRFNPANASTLKIGLAWSHTGPVAGANEYWIGPVGTAPLTPEFEPLIGDAALPALDTVCPSYKLFDCREVDSLTARTGPGEEPVRFAVPRTVRSPQPRAGGAGFDKGRDWRWTPLVEAWTKDHRHRGTPITLLVHADGPYKGGVWMSSGIDDEDWYLTPEAGSLVTRTARRMKEGVFLLDGGTDRYTYFDAQEVRIGATVVNVGRTPAGGYTCGVTLAEAGNPRQEVSREWPVQLAPGERRQFSTTCRPQKWPSTDGAFACNVSLRKGATAPPVDALGHAVHAWRPRADKHFVTIQHGRFMLDGRRWRAHGINYMPSSGIGTEDNAYFEDWTGPRAYDPEVIQRDLERVKELGYNAVSVFTDHRLYKAQNIIDLIRRCERFDLKVNLFLRPSYPMRFQFAPIREMIEQLHLVENDTVFAYDIDWEPMFLRQADRVAWDREWATWIIERYGSFEAAEKDWGFAVPRDGAGEVTNPSAQQVMTDGNWRRMVAAYRRFLDTLLYQKYSAARRLISGVDPNHLVSFRMTEAGNPTCVWDGIMPYDFPYLVSAVDFLSPEAYGRIGDWDKVKPGWFEREYARWADPAKPMIWAEMGMSTWVASTASNSDELLTRQADFYRHFYRMLIASGADGVFAWWYPGGFRWNENSDFGVINPDGSDRPVTRVIREMARPFLEGPDLKPVDTWIEFDRDPYPSGISGAYEAVKETFWKAIEAGKTPGLQTAGTGTDSRTCPMIAVGNTPCNGSNPPKYLDAVFDLVEVRDGAGQWQPVTRLAKVTGPVGRPVRIRVRLTNLGEARWIAEPGASSAPESIGGVYVALSVADHAEHHALPRDVDHRARVGPLEFTIPTAPQGRPQRVVVSLFAAGRGPFGERFAFVLE